MTVCVFLCPDQTNTGTEGQLNSWRRERQKRRGGHREKGRTQGEGGTQKKRRGRRGGSRTEKWEKGEIEEKSSDFIVIRALYS